MVWLQVQPGKVLFFEDIGHEFVLLETMCIRVTTLSIRQSTSQCAKFDGRTLGDEGGIWKGRFVTDIILAVHIDVVVIVSRSFRSLRRRSPVRGTWYFEFNYPDEAAPAYLLRRVLVPYMTIYAQGGQQTDNKSNQELRGCPRMAEWNKVHLS